MIPWLNHHLHRVRIALAYPRFEKARRVEHQQIANARYSTEHLHAEVRELVARADAQASAEFDAPLAATQADLAKCEARIAEFRHQHDLLQRSFQDELDEHYARVADLTVRIDALYEEKRDAHEQRQAAQASIDNWYQQSRSSFGHKGREIPKRNLFGRSQDDLEFFKAKKSSSIATIRECADEIATLKEERGDVFELINALKLERREMFKLKRQGLTSPMLLAQISELSEVRDRLAQEVSRLRREKGTFIREAHRSLGIGKLEQEIARLDSERQCFLASFDTAENKAKLKVEHERAWAAARAPATQQGQ